MSDIPPPPTSREVVDRHIDCQDALYETFREIIRAATSAGWEEQEVAVALANLSDNHVLSLQANGETEALIALLRRMK